MDSRLRANDAAMPRARHECSRADTELRRALAFVPIPENAEAFSGMAVCEASDGGLAT
jgi:hypothetical protein